MKAALPQKSLKSLCLQRALYQLFNLTTMSVMLLPAITRAQDATGALQGRLTDKSGSAVANATIQLKNIETNAIRSQKSDAEGFYRLVELSVGHYSLTVDAPGFAHFSESPIDITVSQTSRIDIPLALASVTESVAVSDTLTNRNGRRDNRAKFHTIQLSCNCRIATRHRRHCYTTTPRER